MIKIVRSSELKTSRWSGGSTTQLFIFPAGSDYKKMDFDFRISTATIEAEKSSFTPLPGVKRTLMVLEGTLELSHAGHHSTILEPFETDSFLGNWETTSGGKATDFNLMVRKPDLEGSVRMMLLGKKSDLVLEADTHAFIYICKGEILVDEKETLSKGDSVYFDSSVPLRIRGKSSVQLIYVSIR